MNELFEPYALKAPIYEKRLRSGDKYLIVTDIYQYTSSYYDYSQLQIWFRVGALDLVSHEPCFLRFTKDDARAMLRAGVKCAPWPQPHTLGISVHRAAHDNNQEKGRFDVTATLVEQLPPELLSVSSAWRREFTKAGHFPNTDAELWKSLAAPIWLEQRIEKVALELAENGSFSAKDLKTIFGSAATSAISKVLKQLVLDGRLVQEGKKKGATYRNP